jgi:hypothetical protein
MFEAHFLPVHITFHMLGSGIYTLFTPSTQIPGLYASDLFRHLPVLLPYELFQSACVSSRETVMAHASLAGRLIDGFSHRTGRKTGIDFLLFPIADILYGSLPMMVALIWQLGILGFWQVLYRLRSSFSSSNGETLPLPVQYIGALYNTAVFAGLLDRPSPA